MHIPKCAGTTLRAGLEARFGRENLALLYSQNYQFGRPDQPLSEFSQSFVIGHFGVNYFKGANHGRQVITFVRDPVDRVLSHYFYWHSTDHGGLGPKLARCLSLADFLRSDLLAVRRQISNTQTWMMAANIDMVERHRLACTPHDDLLDMAKENLAYFDFIGLTETFDQDADYLNEKYAWGIESPWGRTNKTERRQARDEIDDEVLDLLHGVTAMDRRLYEYIKREIYPNQFAVTVPLNATQQADGNGESRSDQ